MIVKLLTERHLEFLSLKVGCRGSSESTHVQMPDCWKSHVMAQMSFSGVECSDVPVNQMDENPAGFICSACPVGLIGDGQDCQGKDMLL